jgi:hypothetical protein
VSSSSVLEIRPVTADDTNALLQILGDPEVAYWLRPAGESGPFSRAECEQIIVRKLAHWTAFGFGMSLAFSDGRCVGRSTVGYNLVDGRAEVEIGWAVVRDGPAGGAASRPSSVATLWPQPPTRASSGSWPSPGRTTSRLGV